MLVCVRCRRHVRVSHLVMSFFYCTVSKLSQLTVQISDAFGFEPPFGGLGTTYDVHLGFIGKRVVDFLLLLIELFSLGVTAEALRANIGSKSAISLQRGLVDPKFQVEGIASPSHSSQKTKLNDLSHGIKIWTDFFPVLSQCTRLTDRQTDRRTEFSSLGRVCIPCSAVKMR